MRLDQRFAGESFEDKLRRVRGAMETAGQGALVLTALDEVAWLLNLRGSDIEYNPVFFAFAIVLPESATLYCDAEKLPVEVTQDKVFAATYQVRAYCRCTLVLRSCREKGRHHYH